MHVAYIHQHFSTLRGATGTRSYEMSQRLIAAKHRVTMVCGAYDVGDPSLQQAGRISHTELDGIQVIRIPQPYSNRMNFLQRIAAFGRFARKATRIVSRLDADIVFATSTPLTVGISGMKGAKRLGVPFVFEVRDLWPELPIALGIVKHPLMKWYLSRMERRIYQAADRIIALAPGIKAGICKTGYDEKHVTMIPNCCDLDLFRPRQETLEDPRFGEPDDFRLVFTGAHGLANGLHAVLDAAADLKRRGVTGIRFVFIGGGSQRDQLMSRSTIEGLDTMVSWVPSLPKEELADLLPRMDVGMMILKNLPAFYFGTSPNKFFDYIASGLPVLNNYPGWLAGLIEEHRCGVVVPPDDPKSFADAVLRLREEHDTRRSMGCAARRLAENHFSRDVLGERFVLTLEDVYKDRGCPST